MPPVAVKGRKNITYISFFNKSFDEILSREHYFAGESSVRDFVRWAFFTSENANCYIYCHFGGGYDFLFFMRELLHSGIIGEGLFLFKNTHIFAIPGHTPENILSRDLRVLRFKAGRNCVCLDTYNWFRTALRNLPQMWGLSVEKKVKKGYKNY